MKPSETMAAVISDDDMIARLLAEANFFGWEAIAKKYRLSKTTFFRYKNLNIELLRAY